jgi:hypothetical protein
VTAANGAVPPAEASREKRRGNSVTQTITLTLDGLGAEIRKAFENGGAAARQLLDSTSQALEAERNHSAALTRRVLELTDAIRAFTTKAVELELIKGRKEVELEQLRTESEDTKLLIGTLEKAASEVKGHLLGTGSGSAAAALKEVLGEVLGELMADRPDAVAMRTQLREFLGNARWSRLMELSAALF